MTLKKSPITEDEWRARPAWPLTRGAFPDVRWLAFRAAIEDCVARVFGVERTEIEGATRGRARAALARQSVMYLAHVALSMSYTDVGQLFRRDRTTVAHGCAVVEDRRDEPRFDRAMELLETAARALLSSHAVSSLPRPRFDR